MTSLRAGNSSISWPICAGWSRCGEADGIDRECEYFVFGDLVDDLTETHSHGMRQRLVFALAPAARSTGPGHRRADGRNSIRTASPGERPLCARRPATAGRPCSCPLTSFAIAEEIADRLCIMDQGRLHFLGTRRRLQDELASRHACWSPCFWNCSTAAMEKGSRDWGSGEWGVENTLFPRSAWEHTSQDAPHPVHRNTNDK